MDWTPLENAAVLGAAGIVSACGVVAASYVRAHVKNVALRAAAADAATLGAGIAYDSLSSAVSQGKAPDWNAAKQTAIAEGTAAAAKEFATDLSPVAVASALSSLLAKDPTVPAGNASTAVATAAAGGAATATAAPKAVSGLQSIKSALPLLLLGGLSLAGCAGLATAFNTTPTPGETSGQLFCQIDSSAGVAQIIAVINADVPGAVLVTGLTQGAVQAECAAAAASAGAASGVPVSPPANAASVASVAIPASAVAAPAVSPTPAS